MKTINIAIDPDEVLYDIGMNIYTIGERMVDLTDKARFTLQSGLDDNNKPLVVRAIRKAWQEVLQTLSAYSHEPLRKISVIKGAEDDVVMERDNTLTEKGAYDTTLYFPDNIPDDMGDSLVAAIHDYLVSAGTGLWTKRTASQEAQIFLAEAAENLNNIMRIATNRTRPVRIKGYGY